MKLFSSLHFAGRSVIVPKETCPHEGLPLAPKSGGQAPALREGDPSFCNWQRGSAQGDLPEWGGYRWRPRAGDKPPRYGKTTLLSTIGSVEVR